MADLWNLPPNPHLALSLKLLRRELDKLYPRRSRESDGWLGDTRHSRRVSDHNPDKRGLVHAHDFTVPGCRPRRLVYAVTQHPSAHYVIWDRKIWSRSHGWEAQRYTGPNPHTDHVHVSILHDPEAERCLVSWIIGKPSHF